MKKFKIMLQRVFLKIFAPALAIFILFTLTCSEADSGTEPDQDIFPEKDLSYNIHIRPIFLEDCAAPGQCHSSAIRDGGLDLEANPPDFQGDNELWVIPGRSDLSRLDDLLYTSVATGGGTISRMPPDSFCISCISDAEIEAIVTWIEEGANTAN